MTDRNFVWDPEIFKVLGIMFSTKTNIIPELKFQGKLEEARCAIAKWSKNLVWQDCNY